MKKVFKWLVGICGLTLSVMLSWSILATPQKQEVDIIPNEASDIEALRSQVQRLEKQLIDTRRDVKAIGGAPTSSANGLANVEGPKRDEPVATSADVDPELREQQLHERAREQLNKRYAFFEQRFAEEPLDEAASSTEVEAIHQRAQETQGYELLKAECRYTMCRLELKAEATTAQVVSHLGFRFGADVRRRDDGTYLVFAGREGFPFQELHRMD